METGVIVDLETTGLNSESDKIIEIGLVKFTIESSAAPAIVESYGALEDPGIPLTPEIQKITGLSDKVLAGRQIDWQRVITMLEDAVVVVAHNVAFDRAFLLKRPEIAALPLHFACSSKHIDWKGKGFGSGKLSYLAADHGFLNPFPHRALFDCATTFKLIAPHLDEMIKRSFEREYLISAWDSPFDTKDALKSRGYRWDAQKRVWQKTLTESILIEERIFLQKEVYRSGDMRHEEQQLV